MMLDLTPICPSCNSKDIKIHGQYDTKNHGLRHINQCNKCNRCFSLTFNTLLAGIRKPISLVIQVVKARTEGLGLNNQTNTAPIRLGS